MIQQPNYAPGMRDAANQLRAKVEYTSSLINRLDAQLASMSYAGPAADRFRGEMAQSRSILVQANSITHQLIDILLRDAQRIESNIASGLAPGGELQ